MDITVVPSKPRRGKALKVDPWDGTMSKTFDCVFCGHDSEEHDSRALMVRRPGSSRRMRAGLRYLACRTCAADKSTGQVVCYKAPSDIEVYAERVGLIF